MAKTCVQLIARIKQLVGRSGNTNATLDLDTIILDALNDGQVSIVRKNPHILDLQVKDITSVSAITNVYAYSLIDTEYPVAHLSDVWLLNGTASVQLRRKHKEDFDLAYPDVASRATATPKYYTRRGNTIEFDCPVSSAWNGKVIRLDYCKWAAPFASAVSAAPSDLQNADKGLLLYAWSETLRVLARGNAGLLEVANEKLLLFNAWMEEFSEYHDMQQEELTYGS